MMEDKDLRMWVFLSGAGAVMMGMPYLLRLFGPTEVEVAQWGRLCVAAGMYQFGVGVSLKLLSPDARRSMVGLGALLIAVLQVLPIVLWFGFHGTPILDGTPQGGFEAHWAFSFPHVALCALGLALAKEQLVRTQLKEKARKVTKRP